MPKKKAETNSKSLWFLALELVSPLSDLTVIKYLTTVLIQCLYRIQASFIEVTAFLKTHHLRHYSVKLGSHSNKPNRHKLEHKCNQLWVCCTPALLSRNEQLC